MMHAIYHADCPVHATGNVTEIDFFQSYTLHRKWHRCKQRIREYCQRTRVWDSFQCVNSNLIGVNHVANAIYFGCYG